MPNYLINGAGASIEPVSQEWIDIVLGQTVTGRTLYRAQKEVVLTFDTCAISHFKQWEDVVTGGSVTTLTMLQPDAIAYTGYSSVFLTWDKRPVFEAGLAKGPWSIRVKEVTP